ncbi:hypothetical protein [Streptomyces sp. NPDC018031]|uniref:effector-associated constant component EACC1 n=1 Tax=Streptomyces sp. NPDC018031 TaxID=3365033 RepID=UPI0037953328
MAELSVRVGGPGAEPEDELRSLLRWLRQDESLDRLVHGRVAGEGAPVPGAMGTGFDVLQLVLGSGLSAGALAVSILQWRDARRTRPVLTLRRGALEVRLPADGSADAETVRRVVALLQEAPATAAGGHPGPAGGAGPQTGGTGGGQGGDDPAA